MILASHARLIIRNYTFLKQGNYLNLSRSCKTGLVEALILVEVHEQSILGLHSYIILYQVCNRSHAPVIYTKIHIDLP